MRPARHLRPGADADVPDRARLAAHDDVVAELGGARDAGLGDDHAMATDYDVVPDLDEIINFRSFTDDRILKRASVDGRIRANLHVVLDDDAVDLRHLEVPLAAHGEAEPVLADADTGMDRHAVAEERVRDRRERADVAIAADRHSRADHGTRRDARAAPDHRLWTDDGAGLDHHAVLELRRLIDRGRALAARHPRPKGCG